MLSLHATSWHAPRSAWPRTVSWRRRPGPIPPLVHFTDPSFGIGGHWEGHPGEPELPHAVYRIGAHTGHLHKVLDELAGPNGLCFSPDESVLCIAESRATPTRKVWAHDVGPDGRLSGRRLAADADGPGAFDGIRCDEDGNLWCGWGSSGVTDASPAVL